MWTKEFVEEIALECGCSKSLVKDVLRCFFEKIKDIVSMDENLRIKGFGMFKVNWWTGSRYFFGKKIEMDGTRGTIRFIPCKKFRWVDKKI
jgi:nucleoid DNA-binding protein